MTRQTGMSARGKTASKKGTPCTCCFALNGPSEAGQDNEDAHMKSSTVPQLMCNTSTSKLDLGKLQLDVPSPSGQAPPSPFLHKSNIKHKVPPSLLPISGLAHSPFSKKQLAAANRMAHAHSFTSPNQPSPYRESNSPNQLSPHLLGPQAPSTCGSGTPPPQLPNGCCYTSTYSPSAHKPNIAGCCTRNVHPLHQPVLQIPAIWRLHAPESFILCEEREKSPSSPRSSQDTSIRSVGKLQQADSKKYLDRMPSLKQLVEKADALYMRSCNGARPGSGNFKSGTLHDGSFEGPKSRMDEFYRLSRPSFHSLRASRSGSSLSGASLVGGSPFGAGSVQGDVSGAYLHTDWPCCALGASYSGPGNYDDLPALTSGKEGPESPWFLPRKSSDASLIRQLCSSTRMRPDSKRGSASFKSGRLDTAGIALSSQRGSLKEEAPPLCTACSNLRGVPCTHYDDPDPAHAAAHVMLAASLAGVPDSLS